MVNCPGCKRDLPRSLYPKHGGGRCFYCIFGGEPPVDLTCTRAGKRKNKRQGMILEILRESDGGLTTSQVASRLRVLRATAYNYLKELEENGSVSHEQRWVKGKAMVNVYHYKGGGPV